MSSVKSIYRPSTSKPVPRKKAKKKNAKNGKPKKNNVPIPNVRWHLKTKTQIQKATASVKNGNVSKRNVSTSNTASTTRIAAIATTAANNPRNWKSPSRPKSMKKTCKNKSRKLLPVSRQKARKKAQNGVKKKGRHSRTRHKKLPNARWKKAVYWNLPNL